MSREADIHFTIAVGPLHPFLSLLPLWVFFFAVGLFQIFFFSHAVRKLIFPLKTAQCSQATLYFKREWKEVWPLW